LGFLKNIVKGIAIGISMMVPGVSGGTMAIVLGVYDRLVHSVAAFFSDWKKNMLFLLQVGAGGAAGIIIFSRFMEGAMLNYPHIMRYLIMGIIIGGLPLLYRKASDETGSSPAEAVTAEGVSAASNDSRQVKKVLAGKNVPQPAKNISASSNDTHQANNVCGGKSVLQPAKSISSAKNLSKSEGISVRSKAAVSDFLFLILGIVIVLLMSLEPDSLIGTATDGSLVSYIFLLVSGFVIAVGLVLPGISWSFMLLVLGMYEITLNAINTFNIPFLIPLGIGIGLGTIGTAKLIEKFLQRYPRKTYMLIIGFVVGSLAEVFPGIPQDWQVPVSLAAFAAGFAAMFVLGKKGLAD